MSKKFKFHYSFLILSFFALDSVQSQTNQINFSSGISSMYLEEHIYTNKIYKHGIATQIDLVFLDSTGNSNYGISIYSNSVNSYSNIENELFYNGAITNTGVNISKYFEKYLSPRFIYNFQIGSALNLETLYSSEVSSLLLNINIGSELKYNITKKWFLLVKGLAIGQDVPNIIRYYTYGDYQEAREDLHLMILFGVSRNIGK